MREDMGTFRVGLELANPARPGEWRTLDSALVDTGAELSWFPAPVLESLGIEWIKVLHFRQADGTVLARRTGGEVWRVAGIVTNDEVVFGEPGDRVLLGAHSLEDRNLCVDPVSKQLIDAGPAPAAATRDVIPPSHGSLVAASIASAVLDARWTWTAPVESTATAVPAHAAATSPPVRMSQ
jgi:hypothetical protein